jgi:glycosyltransferase involved in cell wall biosynthesis
MRILLVDLETVWRGGQSQAVLLLDCLRNRGHNAELISVEDSALADRAQAAGFSVHTSAAQFRRAQAAREIRKLLRIRKFDVIHANEAHALTAAWLARAHREAPLVVSRRVAFPLSKSSLGRARYATAQRIIAISQFVAKSVLASGIPPDSVQVVHDGVELPNLPTKEERAEARAHYNFSPDDVLIGCVGYLLPEKRQECLVRALPLIRERIPKCNVVLAGKGPCHASLKKLALQLGVGGSVKFLGHVDNIAEIYRMLNLFVFPSLAEPLGSALLSAMSYALPTIAIASGGVPEIINESCGILLPASDPHKIAEAATSLLNNRDVAARLGAAARDRIAQNFTADRMTDSTLNIYSESIKSRA